MSDLLLLAAPLAVLGLVAAIWWLGGLQTARIASVDHARARLRRDHLDFEARDVVLASDGCAALLQAEDARIGLVFAVGDKLATRLLRPGDLARVSCERAGGETRYELRFKDFTNRRQRFVVGSGDAQRVEALLVALGVDLLEEAA